MQNKKNRMPYAASGVNIDIGNEFVDKLKPMAKETFRPGVLSGLGGFGGLFDLKAEGYQDPILVASADGVGTKLRIAIDILSFETIGIDLVAMCVNDLICQGAEPLFFLDYFATGRLELKSATVVLEGITHACLEAGCSLIGGETAEMPGMYTGNDFDLAGFAVGAFERGNVLPRRFKAGDIILGLPSNGLHSNGFSLVRKVVKDLDLKWSDKSPFSKLSIGEELLKPTKIYVKQFRELLSSHELRALSHITGGGITENISRILHNGLGAKINLRNWNKPEVFHWLAKEGRIPEKEMLRTFNCGIGLAAVVPLSSVKTIKSRFLELGQSIFEIGQVVGEEGVFYEGNLF